MPEMINSINDEKDFKNIDWNQKFLFIEKISALEKIPPQIELCIIESDFDEANLTAIKKAKTSNKKIEFWISSKSLSKENIIIANKLGIKTVISSPIDKKMVEEFFINKYGGTTEDTSKYDFSGISNSKIMIVDDNSMNVELLEEILSGLNVEIKSFLKPREAQLAILNNKYDLFLLDIMMPEMSGFDLAKTIKETPHNKDVPIIFISALSDSHNKIKGYDLGSCAYIEKPFDVNIIKSQIFSILKNRKTQEILTSSKENFLATVAHDLKTPINAGINALNLLLNQNFGELDGEQQEIIEDILNSTKFMQDMVENILCKSKMDNNKISLSKQVCPLKKLVEHCIELTKYILVPKNQQIDFRCQVDNTLLPIDFLEMKRALHNLIANASEYSPNGGKILIEVFEKNKQIGLSIQDFGKGIDIKHQGDVFSQYMSLAKEHKRVGSGLGLYITKKIIEAHDGEITLESKIGKGTKITVLLPLYSKE